MNERLPKFKTQEAATFGEIPEHGLLIAMIINAMSEAAKCSLKPNQTSRNALIWITNYDIEEPWTIHWILTHLSDDPDGLYSIILKKLYALIASESFLGKPVIQHRRKIGGPKRFALHTRKRSAGPKLRA